MSVAYISRRDLLATLGNAVLGNTTTQANVIPPPPNFQGDQDYSLWREIYQESWDSRAHTKLEWATWRYLEMMRGAP